jgi:hypothetical protein
MGPAFSREKTPLPMQIVFFQESRKIFPGNPEGEQIFINFLSLPIPVPLVTKENP